MPALLTSLVNRRTVCGVKNPDRPGQRCGREPWHVGSRHWCLVDALADRYSYWESDERSGAVVELPGL